MIRRHADSINHAIDGMVWAWRAQPIYKTHLALVIITFIAGWLLEITRSEWIVLISVSFFGLVIETLNTAIEKMGDAIDANYNEHIKISKDVSAAAMLLYSLGAVVVATMIFLPRIVQLILTLL